MTSSVTIGKYWSNCFGWTKRRQIVGHAGAVETSAKLFLIIINSKLR